EIPARDGRISLDQRKSCGKIVLVGWDETTNTNTGETIMSRKSLKGQMSFGLDFGPNMTPAFSLSADEIIKAAAEQKTSLVTAFNKSVASEMTGPKTAGYRGSEVEANGRRVTYTSNMGGVGMGYLMPDGHVYRSGGNGWYYPAGEPGGGLKEYQDD